MKYISFSLYGSREMYTVGMIRNAHLAQKLFSSWRVVCYYASDVPLEILRELASLNVDLRRGPEHIRNQMCWRFTIADDPSCERYLIRDADSRLNERERACVDVWEQGGQRFLVLRDHPFHSTPMMGGLWGAVADATPPMSHLLAQSEMARVQCAQEAGYGLDQDFLTQHVWPIAQQSVLEFDSCCRHRYPKAREFPEIAGSDAARFCGEIFEADDSPHPNLWKQRTIWLSMPPEAKFPGGNVGKR